MFPRCIAGFHAHFISSSFSVRETLMPASLAQINLLPWAAVPLQLDQRLLPDGLVAASASLLAARELVLGLPSDRGASYPLRLAGSQSWRLLFSRKPDTRLTRATFAGAASPVRDDIVPFSTYDARRRRSSIGGLNTPTDSPPLDPAVFSAALDENAMLSHLGQPRQILTGSASYSCPWRLAILAGARRKPWCLGHPTTASRTRRR